MPVTRKNTTKKVRMGSSTGKRIEEVTIVTKTAIRVSEASLPKKFKKMNEMLAKATLLPS